MSVRLLRSRRALFEQGAFASVPRSAGPASAEAERRLHSWGSQVDLVEGMEMGQSLSPSISARSSTQSLESDARSAVPSTQGEGSTLRLSSFLDVESVDRDLPLYSPQYEELLEEVTRVVAKLSIDWPAEKTNEPQRSKLDERFLRASQPPPSRGLPFFPDLHEEIASSWKRPFSARLYIPSSDYYGNVVGMGEHGYRAMPRVEQTLVSYLSPSAASSLKAPALPSKPLRTTSALVGKGYAVAEMDSQVLELPYVGKNLSMLIILPNEIQDETTGLQKLEKALSYEKLMEWTKPSKMCQQEVEVSLPRFKMEETYDMKCLLISMGMEDVFDGQKVNLSGMSPNNDLVVSKVIHKAFVEVNEEGIEAAGATRSSVPLLHPTQSNQEHSVLRTLLETCCLRPLQLV